MMTTNTQNKNDNVSDINYNILDALKSMCIASFCLGLISIILNPFFIPSIVTFVLSNNAKGYGVSEYDVFRRIGFIIALISLLLRIAFIICGIFSLYSAYTQYISYIQSSPLYIQ